MRRRHLDIPKELMEGEVVAAEQREGQRRHPKTAQAAPLRQRPKAEEHLCVAQPPSQAVAGGQQRMSTTPVGEGAARPYVHVGHPKHRGVKQGAGNPIGVPPLRLGDQGRSQQAGQHAQSPAQQQGCAKVGAGAQPSQPRVIAPGLMAGAAPAMRNEQAQQRNGGRGGDPIRRAASEGAGLRRDQRFSRHARPKLRVGAPRAPNRQGRCGLYRFRRWISRRRRLVSDSKGAANSEGSRVPSVCAHILTPS